MRSRSTDRPERPRPLVLRGWAWGILLGVMTGACHPAASPASPETPAAVTATTEASAEDEGRGQGQSDAPAAEAPLRLHLSFDDAPWMQERGDTVPDVQRVAALNASIVAMLEEEGVPASVFFNCDRLQPGERSVELWAEAGMEVGNHTSTHVNLANVSLEEWQADVERCHAELSRRLPAPPRYFRYPYLGQGDTLEKREGAKARLAALGYANAHVTVATTEWLLAYTYRAAKRKGDAALEAEVVQAYRDHMVEAVEQGRVLARAELGHDVTHVVLLHVNELAADHLPEVLAEYRARGWALVGLEEALRDPVYGRVDHYVGRGGLSWLVRIHEDPETRPAYWFGDEEMRLMERYGELWQPPAPP